jgi:hypothetical protein
MAMDLCVAMNDSITRGRTGQSAVPGWPDQLSLKYSTQYYCIQGELNTLASYARYRH